MTDCLLSRLPDGRVRCTVCGWESRRALSGRARRECGGTRDVTELAAVCLACAFHRPHARAGIRCTMAVCSATDERGTVDIAGAVFNRGLAHRLLYGRCPDGRF